MEFINYAHRGASAYAPENTLAAFYMGWQMRANGVETDVQSTKDGVLVLFHDKDMKRIANRPETIQDMTYEELLDIDMGIHMGSRFKGERIPTLEEFLRHFGQKELHFAIEIKERGVEAEALKLIHRYISLERVIITSGIWESLVAVHQLDRGMRLGYLAKALTEDMLRAAKAEGIGQICPRASLLNAEWNQVLRSQGFSVRPWGIDSPETMRRMLNLKVDGMTINFPDVLTAELQK